MADLEATTLAGSFFGIFMRSIIDYIRAREQAKLADPDVSFTFDKKFLGTAVIAAIGAGTGAVLLFPALMAQIPMTGSPIAVFTAAAGLGYMANDLLNKAVSLGQSTIRVTKEEVSGVRQFLTSKRNP